MKSLKIESIKEFMSALLSGEAFDKFQVSDAEIRTLITTKISGALQNGWLSGEEKEELGLKDYVYWKQVRPVIFHLVKGSKVPSLIIIHFVTRLENGDTGVLHIQYTKRPFATDDGELRIITGYNAAEFTLEREKEIQWDNQCKTFLKNNKFPYIEEC